MNTLTGVDLDAAVASVLGEDHSLILQAESDRREALRAVAWDRANQARATRTAWTAFANDEERAAYALALDQQLENIRARNAVDGAEPATGLLSFVARPS